MNLRKILFISIGILIVITLFLIINFQTSATYPQAKLIIENPIQPEFNIEIANTPIAREQGLMYRKSLDENHGMLFDFEISQKRGFWMKNTLIPLDIIFINDQTITKIHENVQPCKADPCPKYASDQPANQVLEINASLSEKYQIQPGQKISIKK